MKKIKAFTMIELLVAIALTMVIAWLVNLAFSNTQNACRRVSSTLDYEAKAKAIISTFQNDLANAHPCLPVVPATAPSDGYSYPNISFHTAVPLCDTHFNSDRNDVITNHKAELDKYGLYPFDFVPVKWAYDENTTTTPYHYRLYRRCNPSDLNNSGTIRSGAQVAAINPNTWTFSGTTDLFVENEIRDFKIYPSYLIVHDRKDITGASSGNTSNFYTISFSLTNAPVDELIPGANTKERRKNAEAKGYIWLDFTAVCPVGK